MAFIKVFYIGKVKKQGNFADEVSGVGNPRSLRFIAKKVPTNLRFVDVTETIFIYYQTSACNRVCEFDFSLRDLIFFRGQS